MIIANERDEDDVGCYDSTSVVKVSQDTQAGRSEVASGQGSSSSSFPWVPRTDAIRIQP